MGRSLTNALTLSVGVEPALGVQPTSGWKIVEPTTIGKYGPTLTKLTRSPISKNRQRRKGALTDLDSSVEFEADLTYNHLLMFAEGLMFSQSKGAPAFDVISVTATGFTVAAGGALAAGTLVVARGFSNPANNGVKVVTSGSIGTEIHAAGLVVEGATAARGATVEICGVQAAAGDLQINAGGNLISTALDFTAGAAASIQVGQYIYVGDVVGGAHSFFSTPNRGLVRVGAKAAHLLTLQQHSQSFVADDGTDTGTGGTAKSIWILWGEFIRNVAVDDPDYIERTYQFELAYENLGLTPGTDEFEYAEGNFCNKIDFDFQTANKATMKCNFIGTDCAPPSLTRATGAATARPPTATSMYNTSADFVRLRIVKVDETGITTDFKNVTLSIMNNVTPEKVLGLIGGKYMNAGEFDVELDGSCLFTSDEVIAAMRNNTTLSLQIALRNDDGGFCFDIPSMTVEGGDKNFPVNQTIAINLKAMAFQDAQLGTSLSLSTFPYLPAA